MAESDAETIDPEADIVTVREKKGLLRSAIPIVGTGIAWAVLFLNVFVPGTGTLVLAFCALCGFKTDLKNGNRCKAFLLNVLTFLLQLLLVVIVVGWIWSIYWGMHVVTEANERETQEKLKRRRKKKAQQQKLSQEKLNDA